MVNQLKVYTPLQTYFLEKLIWLYEHPRGDTEIFLGLNDSLKSKLYGKAVYSAMLDGRQGGLDETDLYHTLSNRRIIGHNRLNDEEIEEIVSKYRAFAERIKVIDESHSEKEFDIPFRDEQ